MNQSLEMCVQAGSSAGNLWRQEGGPDCGRLAWQRDFITSITGEHCLEELFSPWGRENHRI